MKKKCPNCKREIKGHPNKRFCSSRGRGNCKDTYHNTVNPRGIAVDESGFDDDPSWDAHKDY